ncbi:MAG: hypothetical protein JWQ09_5899 [Segetibacter sp.]|nr:hypothetical protein [Segetibacter sp.]
MTIATNIENMMQHPYFKDAVQRFADGDQKDLKIFLTDLNTYVYQITSANNAVAYRTNKNYSPTEIYASIRNMEPPTNLDFRLPIHKIGMVEEYDNCKVISIVEKVIIIKKKVASYFNPTQLSISFPEYPTMEVIEA